MKKHSLIFIAAIVAFGLFLSCNPSKGPEATTSVQEKQMELEIELTPEQLKVGSIALDTVRRASINSTLSLNGLVDVPPQNLVSITCPLGGYVKNINLLPGQEVSKGEVLVVMEDPAYVQMQQDYLVASSKLEYLEKEYRRQQALSATDAASKKIFEQATADLKQEQAIQQGLKEKLALIGINAEKLTSSTISRETFVRSPIHGFISKVPVNRGRYVNPTEILAELVDPADIHASLTVFEKDIPLIKRGQRVWVKLVAKPSESFPADVLLVTRNLDENRAGMVHCHFEQYSKALVPGMAITAIVELEKQLLPAVPEEAILLYKGSHYLFTEVGANKFRMTNVEPGERENGLVAIPDAKDLEGKRVVTKGAFSLLGTLMKTEEEH